MSSSKLLPMPFDIIEEIFCRVPIESLARFITICKQWYTLFKEKRFIYKVLDISKEKLVIQVHHRSIQLFKLEPGAISRPPIPDELHNQVFRKMFHCDGLLLLYMCNEGDMYGDWSRKLAVWNPLLRRVKMIKLSNSCIQFDVFGFGYDNVSRDNYKILRISSPKRYIDEDKSAEIEIYEFKSKLWRSVDATLECYLLWWKYVSMNGNMYWIAQRKMVNPEIEIFIQSFDISTETFKPICCVPDGIDCYPENCKHIILSGFGGDRLSLLHQHKNLKIEVWITNKVTDVIVSWSRFFNVDGPDLYISHSNFSSFPTYYIHKTNKDHVMVRGRRW